MLHRLNARYHPRTSSLVTGQAASVLGPAGGQLRSILEHADRPGFGMLLMAGFLMLVSLLVIAVLFGLIFTDLPDAHVAWRDVAVDALATAIIFVVDKFALSVHLARSHPGTACP